MRGMFVRWITSGAASALDGGVRVAAALASGAPRVAGIADDRAVVGEGAAAYMYRAIIAEAIRPTQPKSQEGWCGLPSSVWLPAAHKMQDAWPVPG